MIIQKYKLKYNINKLNEELNELWPLDNYQLTTYATPTGSYYQNIAKGTMPTHIKEAIELSIGKTITGSSFLWDYRTSKDLIKHKDQYGKLVSEGNVSETPKEIAVVSLENTFTLDIWDDSNDTITESVTYEPGDIVVFNNVDNTHSGKVLHKDISRRTLNCFVENGE